MSHSNWRASFFKQRAGNSKPKKEGGEEDRELHGTINFGFERGSVGGFFVSVVGRREGGKGIYVYFGS